jgi:hypothetical protein
MPRVFDRSPVAIITRILGCDAVVAETIFLRVVAARPWTLPRERVVLEDLTWRCFAEYRAAELARGQDDPIWDLTVPAPVTMHVEEDMS